jgi:hypothetical protein
VERGLGTVYPRGKTWWIQYYLNGYPFRESSNSSKKMVAKELLKKRLGEVSEGKAPALRLDKVMFKDLTVALIDDYKLNERKSLSRAERSVSHLLKTFGKHRAVAITTPKIVEYIKQRVAEGAANATVNRELAVLKRIFNLGAKQTPPQLERVPHIPMPDGTVKIKDFRYKWNEACRAIGLGYGYRLDK